MHHLFVGGPICKVESLSMSDSYNFGPGKLYDARVVKIADAIRTGEIDGEVYADGEVWANPESLSRFRAKAGVN